MLVFQVALLILGHPPPLLGSSSTDLLGGIHRSFGRRMSVESVSSSCWSASPFRPPLRVSTMCGPGYLALSSVWPEFASTTSKSKNARITNGPKRSVGGPNWPSRLSCRLSPKNVFAHEHITECLQRWTWYATHVTWGASSGARYAIVDWKSG